MAINENDYVGFGLDPVTGKRHAINHLPIMEEWEPGIYQFEEGDKIIGGVDGIDNLPLQQLANRTEYLKKAVEGRGTSVSFSITIPASAWTQDTGDTSGYPCHADMANDAITEDMIPFLAFSPASVSAAQTAGVCPSVQTLDGLVRVFAASIPTAALSGTLTLLSHGAEIITDDDFATDEEVSEALNGVWDGDGEVDDEL